MLLFAFSATAVVLASDAKGSESESGDMVACMALHCPKPTPAIQPQPALPSVDVMSRVMEIKNKIHALNKELEQLHKELDNLYASFPKVPEPPVVINPQPNQDQIDQLLKSIEKWQSLITNPATTDEQKKRANQEIANLKKSIEKLQVGGEIGIYPPPPCLGAYLDASGQLRNACEDKVVKPLPITNDQPVACMALHCPKPTPVKPEPERVKTETVKPLPGLNGDVACMALNCPKPTPVKPNPAKPDPVKPTPVKPEPVKPAPVRPTPVKPAQVKPAPVRPTPVKPTPVKPTPVKPTPVKPTPVKPAQVKPAPLKPAPTKSGALKSAPVKSQLVKPATVKLK